MRKRRFVHPWFFRYNVPEGDAGGSGGGNGDPQPNTDKNQPQGGPTPGEPKLVSMTQEQLDQMISDRLTRAKTNWEKDAETKRRQAEMSVADRLKAEKDEAIKAKDDATAMANQRVIKAEAKVIASGLGVKPERLSYVIQLADLSGVNVLDSGEPDAAAITKVIEKILADCPEFKGEAATPPQQKGGGDFSGGSQPGDKPLTMQLIGEMSDEELARRMPEVEAFLARNKK